MGLRHASSEPDGPRSTASHFGIHYGEVIAGNIGAPQRLDDTLIGDFVTTVARIESICKEVGADILASEETRAAHLRPS